MRSASIAGSGQHATFAGPTGKMRNGFWTPLNVVLIWWFSCLSLFLLGWPIPYYQTNVVSVILMMVACATLLCIGFAWARPRVRITSQLSARFSRATILGVLLSVVLMAPTISAYSGFSLGEVGAVLADQGAAFEQGTQRILEGSASRTELLLAQSAAAPFTLVALPYAALYWFEQRRGLLLFLAALAVPLIVSIMVGRDQQLGWSVVVVAAAWLVSRYRRGIGIRVRDVLAFSGVGVLFSILFAWRKDSRGNTGAFCPPGATECLGTVEGRNVFEAALHSVSSYATQGYEGLGRAFDTEWVFGGGISHAPAVHGLLQKLLGFQTSPTVTTQLTSVGWSDTWYWSTALPSLANDIPWLLIPFVFLFQGLLLGSSWARALRHGDFLSVGVFVLTLLGLAFTPQNLQLTASGPTYLGYLILVSVYLVREVIAMTPRTVR